MTDAPLILATRTDGILELSFNRPSQRNALNGAMYLALADALTGGMADPETRVILLRGENGCFTSGNDLADFVPPPESLLAMHVFRALIACDKPVVAAVEGVAIGIGTTLLGHCDFAYAGRSTRFATPFAKLGVCAEGASSLWLPQRAGDKLAAQLLLLGDPFNADTAFAAGLLSAVVDDGSADQHARATAAKLSAAAPAVIQANKALLRADQRPALLERLAREEATFLAMLAEAPARDAIASFLAPRKKA